VIHSGFANLYTDHETLSRRPAQFFVDQAVTHADVNAFLAAAVFPAHRQRSWDVLLQDHSGLTPDGLATWFSKWEPARHEPIRGFSGSITAFLQRCEELNVQQFSLILEDCGPGVKAAPRSRKDSPSSQPEYDKSTFYAHSCGMSVLDLVNTLKTIRPRTVMLIDCTFTASSEEEIAAALGGVELEAWIAARSRSPVWCMIVHLSGTSLDALPAPLASFLEQRIPR